MIFPYISQKWYFHICSIYFPYVYRIQRWFHFPSTVRRRNDTPHRPALTPPGPECRWTGLPGGISGNVRDVSSPANEHRCGKSMVKPKENDLQMVAVHLYNIYFQLNWRVLNRIQLNIEQLPFEIMWVDYLGWIPPVYASNLGKLYSSKPTHSPASNSADRSHWTATTLHSTFSSAWCVYIMIMKYNEFMII